MFDIHSHILPGLDDGPSSLEKAEKMLIQAYNEGITRILCTPHYNAITSFEFMKNLSMIFLDLKQIAYHISPLIRLYQGAEIYYDSRILDLLKKGLCPSLNNTSYILVEFPTDVDYSYLSHCIREIRMANYIPILAHIERYKVLHDVQIVRDIVYLGAYTQINTGTVTGKHGVSLQSVSHKLLQADLVHFIGTDAHNPLKRWPAARKCIKTLDRKIGIEARKRITEHNFMKVIENKVIDIDPITFN